MDVHLDFILLPSVECSLPPDHKENKSLRSLFQTRLFGFSSYEKRSHSFVAIPVATGDRKGRDDTASDNDSSDGDDSDDQGSSPDQPEHRPTTELQQTLLDIVDIIDCLYKLSITIRNPSPHDRLVKATTVDTSFYEQWDIEHVKNKFPAAKVTSRILCRDIAFS